MNEKTEIDPARVEADSDHFHAWWSYNGLLFTWKDKNIVDGSEMTTNLYGFENITQVPPFIDCVVPAHGACYGYVIEGGIVLYDGVDVRTLRAGEWFNSPNGCTIVLDPRSRVVVSQRVGFTSTRSYGGPIEVAGRLRYIDKCSDTLLVCPPVLGDPCFNHLHFPQGIEQTEHTHPSIRSGAVARGMGWCETPDGLSQLLPGVIFAIPSDGKHRFVTSYEEMDVIAYHPDSDWGPTDTEHPMVNRTLVDGVKVDNSQGIHTEASIIDGVVDSPQ